MIAVLASANASLCQYQGNCHEAHLPFTGSAALLVLVLGVLFVLGGFVVRTVAAR